MNREKFRSYTQCQHSGVTNMFDIRTVMNITGLERAEIIDIMKNYKKYREEYGDEEI